MPKIDQEPRPKNTFDEVLYPPLDRERERGVVVAADVWVMSEALRTVGKWLLMDKKGNVVRSLEPAAKKSEVDLGERWEKIEPSKREDLKMAMEIDITNSDWFIDWLRRMSGSDRSKVLAVLAAEDSRTNWGELQVFIESSADVLSEEIELIARRAMDILLRRMSEKDLAYLYFKYGEAKSYWDGMSAILSLSKTGVEDGLAVLFRIFSADEDLKNELVEMIIGTQGKKTGFRKKDIAVFFDKLFLKIKSDGAEQVLRGWLNVKAGKIERGVVKVDVNESWIEGVRGLVRRMKEGEEEETYGSLEAHLAKLDKVREAAGSEEDIGQSWDEILKTAKVVAEWLWSEKILPKTKASRVVEIAVGLTALTRLRKEWPRDALVFPYPFLVKRVKALGLTSYFGETDDEIRMNIDSMLKDEVGAVYEAIMIRLIAEVGGTMARGFEKEKKLFSYLDNVGGAARVLKEVRAKIEVPDEVVSWLYEVAELNHESKQKEPDLDLRRESRAHAGALSRADEIEQAAGTDAEAMRALLESMATPPERMPSLEMMGMYSPERLYSSLIHEGSEYKSVEVSELHRRIEAFLDGEPDIKAAIETRIATKFSRDTVSPFYLVKALIDYYDDLRVSQLGAQERDRLNRLTRIINDLEQVFFAEIGRLLMVHVWGSGAATEGGMSSIHQIQSMILLLLLPASKRMAAKGFIKSIQMKERVLKSSMADLKANRHMFDEREVNAAQTVYVDVKKETDTGVEVKKLNFSDFMDGWEMHYEKVYDRSSKYYKDYQKYGITPKNIEIYILSEDEEEQSRIEHTVARWVAERAGLNWDDLDGAVRSRLIFMAKGSAAWQITTMSGYRVLLGCYGLTKDKIKALRQFRFYIEKYGGPAGSGMLMEGVADVSSRILKGKLPVFEDVAKRLIPEPPPGADDQTQERIKEERTIIKRALKHLFFEETQRDNPVLRPVGDVVAFGRGGIDGNDDSLEFVWMDRDKRAAKAREKTGFFDDPQTREDLLFLMDKMAEMSPVERNRLMAIFGFDEAEVNRMFQRIDRVLGNVRHSWEDNRRGFDRRYQLAMIRTMMAKWGYKFIGNERVEDGDIGEAVIKFGFNDYYDYLRYSEAIEKVSIQMFNFTSKPTEESLLEIFGILKGTTLGADVVRTIMKPLIDVLITWHKGYKSWTFPGGSGFKIDWDMLIKEPMGGLIDEETGLPQYETGEIESVDPLTGMPILQKRSLREVYRVRNNWEDRLYAWKRRLPFVGGDGMSLMQVLHGPGWGEDDAVLNKADVMSLLDRYRKKGMLDGQMVRELAFKHVGRMYYYQYRLGLKWLDFEDLLKMSVLVSGVVGFNVVKDAVTAKK
ncbi:MAG: hypothetical protein GXP43_02050 [bacterium]|nr:hypothetical protein [bacterium]